MCRVTPGRDGLGGPSGAGLHLTGGRAGHAAPETPRTGPERVRMPDTEPAVSRTTGFRVTLWPGGNAGPETVMVARTPASEPAPRRLGLRPALHGRRGEGSKTASGPGSSRRRARSLPPLRGHWPGAAPPCGPLGPLLRHPHCPGPLGPATCWAPRVPGDQGRWLWSQGTDCLGSRVSQVWLEGTARDSATAEGLRDTGRDFR